VCTARELAVGSLNEQHSPSQPTCISWHFPQSRLWATNKHPCHCLWKHGHSSCKMSSTAHVSHTHSCRNIWYSVLRVAIHSLKTIYKWWMTEATEMKNYKTLWPKSASDLYRTEELNIVGELSANSCRQRVSHGQRNGSLWPYSRISRSEPLLFLTSSCSVVLTRLSGPHSRLIASQKMW
jgi:hypothetical protein